MNSDVVPSRDEILESALSLDPADRAYLADELERSLPIATFVSDEFAVNWSGEIDRRIATYDCGESMTVSFDFALDHIRQALAEHRTRQANS